jgi:hypothetical protein
MIGDAEQTGEGWNGCVKPKAIGAYNLDIESRQLPQPLDVFVMFSTAISEMGNPGKPLKTIFLSTSLPFFYGFLEPGENENVGMGQGKPTTGMQTKSSTRFAKTAQLRRSLA